MSGWQEAHGKEISCWISSSLKTILSEKDHSRSLYQKQDWMQILTGLELGNGGVQNQNQGLNVGLCCKKIRSPIPNEGKQHT